MSLASVISANVGNALQSILMEDEIKPGDAPSYQLCKIIAAYHPLGAKMSDSPIKMAQSQQREITVQKGPEDRLKEAFQAEWNALGVDRHIFNVARTARIYGVASLALLSAGTPPDRPLNFASLWDADIGINVFDPLNTAGSLVLDQNPNNLDFQKVGGIAVQGQAYHRSRTVTILNENPLYIEYTTSAFGYVGRSVYQRALYPLKSFVQSMITDNMVSLKAGVLVANVKQPGSIIDQAMAAIGGLKRSMVQQAQTNNVIQIDVDEEIKSLQLEGLEAPNSAARKNILENIATAADMPAVLLNQETFAEGFGEGTEDAKKVAQYIQGIREWMQPLYDFFDKVVQYRAWNEKFYATVQRDFPDDYGNKTYRQAFYEWTNNFSTLWPNLLEEPDSEKVKVDDVKLKAIVAVVEVLLPILDPENKATTIQWMADSINELKLMFGSRLELDYEALAEYEPPQPLAQAGEPAPAPPFSARDSMRRLDEAVARLPDRRDRARA